MFGIKISVIVSLLGIIENQFSSAASIASLNNIPESQHISNSYVVQLKSGIDVDAHVQSLKEATEFAAAADHSASSDRHSSDTYSISAYSFSVSQSYKFGSFIGYSGSFGYSSLQSILESNEVEKVYPDLKVSLDDGLESASDIDTYSNTIQAREPYPKPVFYSSNSIVTQVDPLNWGLQRSSCPTSDINFPNPDTPYYYASVGGYNVTAFVIDSGVNISHPEFEGRAKHGFNAVEGESSEDLHGHGTNVAGIVGSRAFGVAKNVSIVSVKVLAQSGYGSTSGILAAYDWILRGDHSGKPGASVINYSIGTPGHYAPLSIAQSALVNAGYIFVAAAGNYGRDACDYNPGDNPDIIRVGNIDAYNQVVKSSNYGPCVDLYAPGGYITSTSSDGRGTSTYIGTSQSSPHVAGVVALFLSMGATNSTIRSFLDIYVLRDAISGLTGDKANSKNLLLYNNGGNSLNFDLLSRYSK